MGDIGRVFFVGFNEFNETVMETVREFKPGGILMMPGVLDDYVSTVEFFHFLEREGEYLISSDHEGGQMETIPYIPPSLGNLAFGFVDPSITYRYANMAGNIMRALGFNTVFAPVLDVLAEASAPVIGFRSFGSDPKVVSEHGIAAVKGYQDAKVLSCVKHFPGHGRARVDSHHDKVIIDVPKREFWNTDMMPFIKAIEEGVEMVMVAHLVVEDIDDLPASISRKFLKEILREELGFEGLIISDAVDMRALSAHYSVEEIIKRFFEASGDMILVTSVDDLKKYYTTLEKMIRSGAISKDHVDRAVDNVERAIEKYYTREGIGFVAEVARKALKFRVSSRLPKKVHVILPKGENLSPADTTVKYYKKLGEVFSKIFEVEGITEYEIRKGPQIDGIDSFVFDVVVDAFRSEEALRAHLSLREKAKGVFYIIARDPYDENFFKDYDYVVTHSLNPISLYETLTIFKEVAS